MKYPILNLSTIKKIDFPADQYIAVRQEKKILVLHHTASGPGTEGDIKWWKQDTRRVGTCVIIDRTGEIDQCFDSGFWAGHLGTHQANNTLLDKMSIGIEIDAWGPLIFSEGAYRSWTGAKVPNEDVVEYSMGFKLLPGSQADPNYFFKIGAAGQKAVFYHRYTDKQITSVAQLLELWGNGYKIPLNYNADMWDICPRALAGTPGIWTHVSFRTDKADCHPQPELIAMLKSLAA